MRLIHRTDTVNGHHCCVHYNHVLGEYVVSFWLHGKRMKGADYYTDCRSDALETADNSVGQ